MGRKYRRMEDQKPRAWVGKEGGLEPKFILSKHVLNCGGAVKIQR